MRFYPQVTHGVFIVALGALFCFMAAIAALRLGGCPYGMDVKKIGPVAFGCIVTARTVSSEVGADATTLVAVKTVRLFVALAAVVGGLFRDSTVVSDPVSAMIGGDPFAFMAGVAFAYLYSPVILVTFLLGCRLLNVEYRQDKQH